MILTLFLNEKAELPFILITLSFKKDSVMIPTVERDVYHLL